MLRTIDNHKASGAEMTVSPMSPVSPEHDEGTVIESKPAPVPIPAVPSKAEILMSIEKVDAEIAKMEVKISTEKVKIDSARRALHEKNKEVTKARPVLTAADFERNRGEVYMMNHQKALTRASKLVDLLGGLEIDPCKPLYTTPQSAEVWRANESSHQTFGPFLLKHLSREFQRRNQFEHDVIDQYIQHQKEWLRRVREMNRAMRQEVTVDDVEEEPERRPVAQTSTDIQVSEANISLNEIQNEVKIDDSPTNSPIPSAPTSARSSRALRARSSSGALADAVRSEEEFEQVLRELQQEDSRDPRMRFIRTLAKVTPMILTKERRERGMFVSTNLLVTDPVGEAEKYKVEHPWEDHEIRIFKERWLQYPKEYRKIASYLPRRSVGDVVRFYFLNKHRLGLRRGLRMYQIKKREQRQKKLVVQPQISKKGKGQNRNAIDPADLPEYSKPMPRTPSSISISSSTQPGVRWTESERDVFPTLLMKHGKNWQSISDEIVSKSPAQVKHFFRNYRRKYGFDDIIDQRYQPLPKSVSSNNLKARARPTTWTNDEKDAFMTLFQQHGRNWHLIAKEIGGKTPTQVRTYYQNSRSRYGFDSSELTRDYSVQSLTSLTGSSDDQRQGVDVDMGDY